AGVRDRGARAPSRGGAADAIRAGSGLTQEPVDRRLLAVFVLATLGVHLALAGRYGYFRDELYFLDCGRPLDWGYVDRAPMIGLVARLALLLGGSLTALRAIPAVAGAALVALAILIAH